MRWTSVLGGAPTRLAVMSRPPVEHHDPATERNERIVVSAAVVGGAALIAATLRLPRGSGAFYVAGLALAAVWIVASLASGPVRWYGTTTGQREQFGLGVVAGVLTFGGFVGGAAVGRHISVLAGPIDSVLGKADAGPVVAVLGLALVNGVAEELFFRGALVESLPARGALVVSTAIYIAVTAVAGNTALTVAAIVMGAVFAIERRITGGIVASIVTHLSWSTLIILFLPR